MNKVKTRVLSFSIRERTRMTLTRIDTMHSRILYSPACVVMYNFHICIRDYAYSNRLQT